MTPTPAATVARVAFFASDALVDCDPTLQTQSPFADTYRSLFRTALRSPIVHSVRHGADIGSAIRRHDSAELLSLTTSASSRALTRFLPHLSESSSSPVVLHIAAHGDLSNVLLLRSAVPYFLHSSTLQQAHDNALVASKLARSEKKPVVHVFHENAVGDPIPELSEEKIREYLISSKHAANGKLMNGHSNGHTNGRTNGHANGYANGQTNGHKQANGTNGNVSDDSSSSSLDSPVPTSPDDPALVSLFEAYEAASLATVALVRRPIRPLHVSGQSDAHTAIITLGGAPSIHAHSVVWIDVSLVSPLPRSKLLRHIPTSVREVIVLEQVYSWNLKWTPLYLEVVAALQQRQDERRPNVHSGVLGDSSTITLQDVLKLVQRASKVSPSERLSLGKPTVNDTSKTPQIPRVPTHEMSYTKILEHLFYDRLEISNAPEQVVSRGTLATSPEFALGRVRHQIGEREELICAAEELVESSPSSISSELHSVLSKWLLSRDDPIKSRQLADQLVPLLQSASSAHKSVATILALRSHLPALSRWIIGSDAWSYDIGSSGLHHLIASGLNVNTLILDTLPYSQRTSADPARRKRDVGLYAMNHGDVYVASVAVYSSYTQVLQALQEADRFPGPSVVLAYLPYEAENSLALEVLKETKLAVDTGYWPLYRWDPSKEKEGKEPFALDSDAIKRELQEFLDRQNHLSHLTRSKPELAAELVSSLGENVKVARQKRAQQAYDELLNSLSGAPLLVLYASDGGAAEKKAKRLAMRAKARGLATTLAILDSVSLEDLANEENVVFVTSVAGQGEPPQNARTFFKALNVLIAKGEKPLSKVKYSVFGMGDSHYWPRAEDAHYYNKAGKDLDGRLAAVGAERFADLGLGDDQDSDGPETGYKLWEPTIWKALGVDNIEITEAEPDPITNEHLKAASNFLRGTILEGLADKSTGALASSDTQLTKFHGIYQQDDRDIRDERQALGAEPAYSFMIRVRMPGGVCSAKQWLAMDDIADEHGNGTFKITTRQTFQFHGVIKGKLKPSIQSINRALLDTLAACGDVNR